MLPSFDALRIDTNHLNLVDNLRDPAHVSFAHLSTPGNSVSNAAPQRMRRIVERMAAAEVAGLAE